MLKTNIISLFIFFLIVISCKAQTYPLGTYYEEIPTNAHIKDNQNEYDKFVGTWKAILGNKEIYLYVTKQNDRKIETIKKIYYEDVLLVKYKVLINNQEVESTLNFNNDQINIVSDGKAIDGSITLHYKGGKCHIGWGGIILKYINQTQVKWNYSPEPVQITNINCPNNPGNLDIYLPYEPDDIIFIKQ